VSKPTFTVTLLHPRYWLTWLSLLLLAAIAQLPYCWQVFLGKRLGGVMLRFAKKRRAVAARNLRLCFPGMSTNTRKQILKFMVWRCLKQLLPGSCREVGCSNYS
jgi:Kdo2-lipid IVA lauroyltransferase/acyltransferase